VIVRAIEETRPRARYPVTLYAKVGVIARRLLSDGAIDARFRKTFKLDEFRARLAKSSHK
jgi:hypothetical protein